MPNMNFTTRISGEVDGQQQIRGHALTTLIAEQTFASTLFLEITGMIPSPQQAQMLDAILVSSIDHGVAPATGFVPRVVAASGNEMTHALAAGVLAIGPYHGGAIEAAAIMFQSLIESVDLHEFVASKRASKAVISGYGHRVYKDEDPRATALFAKADGLGIDGTYRDLALRLATAIEDTMGRRLVLNVDGAIAAVILDLGLPPKVGNGLFALSRMGGMIAHVLEEQQSGDHVRRLDQEQVSYITE